MASNGHTDSTSLPNDADSMKKAHHNKQTTEEELDGNDIPETSSNSRSIQKCPSLNNHNIDDDIEPVISPSWDTTLTYSVIKVRILLPIIYALYRSNSSLTSLVVQYLLGRWTVEGPMGPNVTMATGNACNRNESDLIFKETDRIQARVAEASVYLSWCSSLPALVTCLITGALVDGVGRKPGLVISQVGTSLKIALVIVIMRFDLSTDLLYLAFALDGIGGSFMAFLVASLSSAADVSQTKTSRISSVVTITTLASLFSSLADLSIGYLIDSIGFVFAAVVLQGFCGIALLLTLFVLPETLKVSEDHSRFSVRGLWTHTKEVVGLYVGGGGSRRTRWSLFLSLMIFFTNTVNLSSLGSTDTLYQKHQPFCWGSVDIGYYAAFRGTCLGCLGIAYLLIVRWVGCVSDEVNSMVSLLPLVGSFVLEACVQNRWQMYLVPVLAIPSANVDAITRGVMSYLAGPDKQGALFSSIALIEVFCVLLAATAYSNVYAITVDYLPGAVYYVMAGMAFVTFLIYIPFFHFYKSRPDKYEELTST